MRSAASVGQPRAVRSEPRAARTVGGVVASAGAVMPITLARGTAGRQPLTARPRSRSSG